MELSKQDIEELATAFGSVVAAIGRIEAISVDIADSDLTVAVEGANDALNAFKVVAAAKIQDGGFTIVQEDEASRTEEETVIMPASIGCSC